MQQPESPALRRASAFSLRIFQFSPNKGCHPEGSEESAFVLAFLAVILEGNLLIRKFIHSFSVLLDVI
jgi:hypothetical protein